MEKLDIKDISQRINDIENLMKQKIVQEKTNIEKSSLQPSPQPFSLWGEKVEQKKNIEEPK